MKIRYFLSLMVAMLLGTMSTVVAQDIEEKVPVTLNGVWQMCFYRSSSPDIPGELKTSNSLKILSDDGRFCNLSPPAQPHLASCWALRVWVMPPMSMVLPCTCTMRCRTALSPPPVRSWQTSCGRLPASPTL